MIFKPELAEKIKQRQKTQTRRIKKQGERLVQQVGGNDKAVITERGAKWQTGRIYSIQPGRTKAGIGQFKLLNIREQCLMDISEEDARAEGVEPLRVFVTGELLYKPAFVSLWNDINGAGSFADNPTVFALTFELVEGETR